MNYDNIFKDSKKTCFIITPVDNKQDEIRRHMDGIIDSIITPVMANDYKITVAHRLTLSGSINKRIIELVYNSDLVIANLTHANPNVMYELAFRHTLGTPTITIAESGSELPFDISSERTIFYKNDIQGVYEAQEELRKCLSQIDYSSGKTIGPIHDYLDSVELTHLISSHNQSRSQSQSQGRSQNTSETFEALDLIVKRLESIENSIPNMKKEILHEMQYSDRAKRNLGLSFPDLDLSKLKVDQTYTFLKKIMSELIFLNSYAQKSENLSPVFSDKLSSCISLLEQCIDNILYINCSN